jgi:CHAD domain-containing protein
VVAVCAPPARVRKLNKKMRALTRYLGPIRELDVELDLLEKRPPTPNVSGRALELVRRGIAAERQALRHELVQNAPVSDLKKLIRKLEQVGRHQNGTAKRARKYEAQWRGALAARLLRRAKALRAAIEQSGPLYAPERLHAVRIATKKLRYALEIAQDAGVPRSGLLIRTLKRHQDRLGHLHDLQALLRHVREAQASPSGSRVSDLTTYADELERDCRRLHAAFVDRRHELEACIKEIQTELIPALPAASRRQASVASARPASAPQRVAAPRPRAK